MKHLYKSKTNKVLTGVIGGLGEYFNIDAVLIRLIWVLVVIFTGFFPGVLAYIVAVFVVPAEPRTEHTVHSQNNTHHQNNAHHQHSKHDTHTG